MNYYPFHLGDYTSHTVHLEPMEDLAYRRLLDQYYLHEGPLPANIDAIAKLIRMRSMTSDVASVLNEFFELTEKGWSNSRCNKEIAHMQEKQKSAKAKANKRWDMHRSEHSIADAMPQHTKPNATAQIIDAEAMLPTPTPTPTPIKESKPKTARNAIHFFTFLENCRADNEKPISTYKPVFDYADKAGLSHQLIGVCWSEFYRRYDKGGVSETKKYADWRKAFRNCVEGNWFKLWWLDPATGQYELTSAGRTAEKVAE